jgi:two-component system response regulator RegX3
MKTRLLLVEDAQDIRETLSYLLAQEGYEVLTAEDGPGALAQFEHYTPDLLLLDWMMPGLSGIDVCRRIRLNSDVPIMILTAKAEESDVVLGLESGADDYLTKPFSVFELLARIRALCRRCGRAVEPRVVIAGVDLDVDRHCVTVDGRSVDLTRREFELLALLMHNAGRVLSRRRIIEQVWGASYFGDGKTLDVHIRRLRQRIERDPAQPRRVETVRGIGYRFSDGPG